MNQINPNNMNLKRYPFRLAGFALSTILIISVVSCQKKNNGSNGYNTPTANGNYAQTNLVSDITGLGAARQDPALVNAWGLAINPHGIMWISGNGTGMTTVY